MLIEWITVDLLLFRMDSNEWLEKIKCMKKLDRSLFTREIDVVAICYESDKEIKDIVKLIKR